MNTYYVPSTLVDPRESKGMFPVLREALVTMVVEKDKPVAPVPCGRAEPRGYARHAGR